MCISPPPPRRSSCPQEKPGRPHGGDRPHVRPPRPWLASPVHARGLRGRRTRTSPVGSPVQSRGLAAVPWLSVNLHCDTGGTPPPVVGGAQPPAPLGERGSWGNLVAMPSSSAGPSRAAPAGTPGSGGWRHPWLSEVSMEGGDTPAAWGQARSGPRRPHVPAARAIIRGRASLETAPGGPEGCGDAARLGPLDLGWLGGVAPHGAFHALYSGSFFCKIFKEKSLYYFFIRRSVCHLSLPRFCFPEGMKL